LARHLVLASASPARLFLLRSAGLDPEVVVSAVAEDGVDHLAPTDAVMALAERKARAVAESYPARPEARPESLVLGCDSLLEFEGQVWGKAATSEEVVRRWQQMRRQTGLLHTGHFLVDLASGRSRGTTDTAVVSFGDPSDREIAAYAATAEALAVAGPFTLEGRSAPWIDFIEGSYGTITGVSLAVLRDLMAQLDVELIDLWS
jgi:septum formation protein